MYSTWSCAGQPQYVIHDVKVSTILLPFTKSLELTGGVRHRLSGPDVGKYVTLVNRRGDLKTDRFVKMLRAAFSASLCGCS